MFSKYLKPNKNVIFGLNDNNDDNFNHFKLMKWINPGKHLIFKQNYLRLFHFWTGRGNKKFILILLKSLRSMCASFEVTEKITVQFRCFSNVDQISRYWKTVFKANCIWFETVLLPHFYCHRHSRVNEKKIHRTNIDRWIFRLKLKFLIAAMGQWCAR